MKLLVKHPRGLMEVQITLPFPTLADVDAYRSEWVKERIQAAIDGGSVPQAYIDAALERGASEEFRAAHEFIEKRLRDSEKAVSVEIRYPDPRAPAGNP